VDADTAPLTDDEPAANTEAKATDREQMWKTLLNKSIKEVRFVLKQTPEHHGAWKFVYDKLPELRMLNQNTFFSITELNEEFTSKSACHVVYGDHENTVEEIETSGHTAGSFEAALRSKVAHGLTLKRRVFLNNSDREIPVETVEARNTVRYMDDGF